LNLLLDTHSFLWFVTNDAKLSATAGNAIQAPSNEVLISPASYREIAIKAGAGRYRIDGPFEEFWNAGIYLNDFRILPITHCMRLYSANCPSTTRIRSTECWSLRRSSTTRPSSALTGCSTLTP
jgi:PIN domain nuclease of toxin-antitoxin system